MMNLYNASGESRRKNLAAKKKKNSSHNNNNDGEEKKTGRHRSKNVKGNDLDNSKDSVKSTAKPEQEKKITTRPRSHTARDEITPTQMKEILQKADIQLNDTLINQLLISFDNTIKLMGHVKEQLDIKEEEEVKRISISYEMEKIDILREIEHRHQFNLP